MADLAALAWSFISAGAIAINASENESVSVFNWLRSLVTTELSLSAEKSEALATTAFKESMMSGRREETALRTEVASLSERVLVPLASVVPCWMDLSRVVSALVMGIALLTPPLYFPTAEERAI